MVRDAGICLGITQLLPDTSRRPSYRRTDVKQVCKANQSITFYRKPILTLWMWNSACNTSYGVLRWHITFLHMFPASGVLGGKPCAEVPFIQWTVNHMSPWLHLNWPVPCNLDIWANFHKAWHGIVWKFSVATICTVVREFARYRKHFSCVSMAAMGPINHRAKMSACFCGYLLKVNTLTYR